MNCRFMIQVDLRQEIRNNLTLRQIGLIMMECNEK